MSEVSAVSKTQKIIVNAATSSVSVINAGPIGPRGFTGPPDAESVLTIDGQIMTRVGSHLAPITRVALAADPAFTAGLTAHVAAADPHPQYLTPAEGNALYLTAVTGDALFLTPAEGDALFLTPAEGDTAYVNVSGDTMTGRLTSPGLTITLGNTILWNAYSGNLWMQDTTWLRWDKSIYMATGILATDGALGIKTGGNVTAGYCADFNGGIRVIGAMNATGSIGCSGVINGYTLSAGVIGNRIVCADASGYIVGNYINMSADVGAGWPAYIAGRNAGDNYLRWYNKSGGVVGGGQFQASNNGYVWNTVALLAYPGTGYACSAYHCGSVAVVTGSVNGTGNMFYVRDSVFNANSANVAAANFSLESSRRWKKNINPYPLLAAGAGVTRVSDILSRLQPMTFEPIASDIEVPSVRRMKALEVVNRMRSAKGMPDYELPIHDCAIHNCNGSEENPCCRVINGQRMIHGFIAEDVYEVFPDAVHLDVDRFPAGVDVGQLLAISIATIKELIDRIDILEGANG